MRRFFNILLGALAMIAVGLLSAFITMRLAIHGREVEVPSVAGLTMAETKSLAAKTGLNVNVENQFYSTVVPAGRVLSQYPAPGTKVRREWVMRVAESIGPQKVSVPNVIGMTEREATVTVRKLSLDLGVVAYIPAPGPAGVVLSQTPTPAAAGVDGPRISLLVSEPVPSVKVRMAVPEAAPQQAVDTQTASYPLETADSQTANARTPDAQTADARTADARTAGETPVAPKAAPAPAATLEPPPEAFVMPNLIGLSLSAATARVTAMGLHISSMETVAAIVRPVAPVSEPGAPGSPGQPSALKPIEPITLANTVVAQSPVAGHRVARANAIHITLSR